MGQNRGYMIEAEVVDTINLGTKRMNRVKILYGPIFTFALDESSIS